MFEMSHMMEIWVLVGLSVLALMFIIERAGAAVPQSGPA